eukprot:350372-Chlamydomonas_euryale.AAC.6
MHAVLHTHNRPCILRAPHTTCMRPPMHADVTLGDKEGYTPMHAAAFTGKHKIIRHLLAAGLDPMDRHSDG